MNIFEITGVNLNFYKATARNLGKMKYIENQAIKN